MPTSQKTSKNYIYISKMLYICVILEIKYDRLYKIKKRLQIILKPYAINGSWVHRLTGRGKELCVVSQQYYVRTIYV